MSTKNDVFSLPAVFFRGGTSKALIFHARDLPAIGAAGREAAWNDIFLRALGSPDAGGRQLDGMGGGISSLSKVAVVGPSSRDDADVDYTFVQVGVTNSSAGYRGNCGNISSAIGPFAVQEGLVAAGGDSAEVRIHNTNTAKIIKATFPLRDGLVQEEGDFVLQGVAGTGAPIRLAFQDPGGAVTGRLLPAGAATTRLAISGLGAVEVSLVDAANPTVFVLAAALGLAGSEAPEAIAADAQLMQRLEDIRVAAAVAMGIVSDADEARTAMRNLPLVAIVAPPLNDAAHIMTRMISAGQPHKATPLTGALCLAAAASIPGTLVHRVARPRRAGDDLIVAHASGLLPVASEVRENDGVVTVREAVVYRTARRLMQGEVYLRPRL